MRRLQEIALKAEDRRAVEAVAKLLRERFPVERVILYGSKARGDDLPDSDIDLVVLTSRPLTQEERRQMGDAVFQIQLEHKVLITKLVISLEDWEHGVYRVLPIYEHVEREGVAA